MSRFRSSHLVLSLLVLLLLMLCGQIWAENSFDTSLAEFRRISGGEVHVAVAGVGTGEGANEFDILVPGDPLAAWIYWSGVTTPASTGDGDVTISGGALAAPQSLAGVEIGRRLHLFADESDSGGEVVMKADVPLFAFSSGVNRFSVSDLNEVVDDARAYRSQHGAVMVVFYQVLAGEGDWESIGLEGTDVSNFDRYHNAVGYQEQANSDVICFDFSPLSCDTTGSLNIGIGGVLEDVHQLAGSDRVAYASPERTWFATGMGPKPTTLIDVYQILEENKIIDADFGFVGEKLGVFNTSIDLPEGSEWACFQHELLEKKSTDEFPQSFATFVATMDYNRYCKPPGQCLLNMSLTVDPPSVVVGETYCDGPITKVSFEYTGQGCEASTHQQGNKASCSGAAAFTEPVTVEMHRADGTFIGSEENIHLGDVISFSARQADLDQLGKNIVVEILDDQGMVLETNSLKLRCEKKFNIGDQFGSMLAVAYTSTAGTERDLRTATTVSYTVTNDGDGDTGELSINDDLLGEVGFTSNLAPGESITFQADTTTWKQTRFDAIASGEFGCEASGVAVQSFTEPPDDGDPLECEGGIKTIVMTYTGESCEATTNGQNGKVRCVGDALFTDGVTIRVKNKKGRRLYTYRDVNVGDVLSLNYSDLGSKPGECGRRAKRRRPRHHKRKLPNNLVYQIIDQATGERLQGLRIHTSCSQPLFSEDKFGAFRLDEIESRR